MHYRTFLLFIAIVVTPCVAEADLLWDQPDCGLSDNGVFSQRVPMWGNGAAFAADDFVVPAGRTYTVELAESFGFFGSDIPLTAEVQIWSDDGGQPGTMLCQETGANLDDGLLIQLPLVGDCRIPLSPGRYWITILSISDVVGQNRWLWSLVPNTPDSPVGRQFHFVDADGITTSPCSDWGSGFDCIGSYVQDLCFRLHGLDELLDMDGDGVGDTSDNCLDIANASQASWTANGNYAPGATVVHNGALWQCAADVHAARWCGMSQYEPGASQWSSLVWTEVGRCQGQAASCSAAVWSAGTGYAAGDRVVEGMTEYACRGFPYTGWCGQLGFRPGVDANAHLAWEEVRWCGCIADDECDDGLFCNGAETCDLDSNVCTAGEAPDCDDGIDCTADTCDEVTRSCEHTSNHDVCDNGAFCDGEEFCFELIGCFSINRPRCDDGVHCTEDRCDPGLDACVHEPVDSLCDNGLFCDGVESCDATVGCSSPGSPCPSGEWCAESLRACGTCGCWARMGLPGNPQTLREVWQTQAPASCDLGQICRNSPHSSQALCARTGSERLSTAVRHAYEIFDASCQLRTPSFTELLLDAEEGEFCLAEHRAFTLNVASGACGLPDPSAD